MPSRPRTDKPLTITAPSSGVTYPGPHILTVTEVSILLWRKTPGLSVSREAWNGRIKIKEASGTQLMIFPVLEKEEEALGGNKNQR